MNRLYRSVWNEISRTFVAVAENVRGRGQRASGVGAEGAAAASERPSRQLTRRRPLPLALEQRFMFDGAAAVDATHAADAAIASAPAPVEVRAADPALDNGKKEVVFVDTSVADYKTLEAGIKDGVAIVEIGGGQDGLAQIAQWAQTHSGYDSISILGHGSQATLNLGTTTLTDASLANAVVAAELAEIGQALTSDGDILLYGCDIAKGTDGGKFIADLASATGADVAASTDRTGAAAKGGDWALEASVGTIEINSALDAQGLAAYNDVLIDSTLTFESGSFSGAGSTALNYTDPTSGATLTFTAELVGGGADAVELGSSSYGAAYHGSEDVYFGMIGQDKSATMTIESGKVFDLNSFYLSNQGVAQTFTITTSEGGSYTTSSIPSSASLTQITLTGEAGFEGIAWFTITPSSGAAYMEIDDIALTNIVAAPPTATVAVADSALRIGETSAVTFTFSQAVTGFTNADIIIANGTLSAVSSSDGGLTWTATLTPTAGITDTTNLITLDMTGVTSVSGSSAGVGTQNSNNYAIDTVRPTLASSIAISDTALRVGDTATATFTFTEAVSGFTIADLNVPNASLSGLSSSDGGITWTATLTPGASTTDSSNVITLDYTGVTDTAGNAGTGTVTSGNYAIDTAAPTTIISTAAFSADTGSSSTDFNTSTAAQTISGTLSANLASGEIVYVSLDNGATWTAASATVGADTWSLGGRTLTASSTLKVKVSDSAGNDGAVLSQAYVFDTTAPTITFGTIRFSADTGSSNTDLVTNTTVQTITATLSGAPAGADTVQGSLDNGSTWTDITTKVSGTTLSWNGVTLTGSDTLLLRVVDAAGNVGASTGRAYTLDTVTPAAPAAPVLAAASDSGASSSDRITADNTPTLSGTAENGSTVTLYDGATLLGSVVATGGSWSYTSGTLADGSHTFTAVSTDAAGNVSAASAGVAVSIDTTAPAVGSVAVPADATYYSGQALDFTVNFNESLIVNTTGGTPRIAIVVGATTRYADYVSGSGTGTLIFRYVVPNGDVDANGITVGALDLNGGTLRDAAGNDATTPFNSVGSTAGINVDGSQPSVISVGASSADGSYAAGSTVIIKVDFSSAVSVDTSGGMPTLALASGGSATYTGGSGSGTLTFSYVVGNAQNSADLDYASTGALVLNGATIVETGGAHQNASLVLATPGTAGSLGANKDIVIDTAAPTNTVAGAVFSADSGTSGSDFITKTAAQTINGTLGSALAVGERVEVSLDNASTWYIATSSVGTSAWSLAGQTLAGSGTLKVRVVDAAGNSGSAYSQAYVLDTTAPTITVSAVHLSADHGSSDTDFITDTSAQTITATLSAAPAGSDVVYGSLDGGANWTNITSKVSGTTITWNGVTLAASNTLKLKVSDAAGNDGAVTSQAYVLDTAAPTTSVVSAAFSADSGVSSTDFITRIAAQTISGTLSANLAAGENVLVSLDNGATWTAASATVGTNSWSLAGRTLTASDTLQVKVSDTAGNDGTVAVQAYVYDTAATIPSVTTLATDSLTPIVSGHATLAAGETMTVSVGGATYDVVPAAGAWTLDLATAVPSSGTLTLALNTTYEVVASVTDLAGNTSSDHTHGELAVGVVPVPMPPTPAAGGESDNSDAPQTSVTEPPPVINLIVAPAVMAMPAASVSAPAATAYTPEPAYFIAPTSPLATASPVTELTLASLVALPSAAPSSADGGSRSPAEGLFVNRGLADQTVLAATAGEFSLPADAFAHTRAGAVVSLQAQQVSGAALPAWIRFDAATGKFRVQAPPGVSGDFEIRVTARDAQGNEAVITFKLRVGERGQHDGGRAQIERQGRPGLSEQLRLAARPHAALERLAPVAPPRHAA